MRAATITSLSSQELGGALLEELLDVYRVVWGFSTGSERPRRWADEYLPLHAKSDGFRFLAARANRRLVGYAYGYTAQAGQWTTDQLAAAMDEDARRGWMEPPPFEVVTLGVHPDFRRQGIGSRLLGALVTALPHRRGVLWTEPERGDALAFYARHGWHIVVTAAEIDARQAVIMGRELSASR